MKYLRKISEHLKEYNVDKNEFASSDMNYIIDMLEKIADNQEIKL